MKIVVICWLHTMFEPIVNKDRSGPQRKIDLPQKVVHIVEDDEVIIIVPIVHPT